jgi:hypothetical protein
LNVIGGAPLTNIVEPMRETFLFLLGALLAGLGVFVYMAKDTQQALGIFEGAEYAQASSRTLQAYQHEPPAIAIWELRHLADIETEQLRVGGRTYGTNGMRIALMITQSRLAKLYHEQAMEAEAQTNAAAAICLLNVASATNSTITNLTSLLERLERTDAQAKKEPRY